MIPVEAPGRIRSIVIVGGGTAGCPVGSLWLRPDGEGRNLSPVHVPASRIASFEVDGVFGEGIAVAAMVASLGCLS